MPCNKTNDILSNKKRFNWMQRWPTAHFTMISTQRPQIITHWYLLMSMILLLTYCYSSLFLTRRDWYHIHTLYVMILMFLFCLSISMSHCSWHILVDLQALAAKHHIIAKYLLAIHKMSDADTVASLHGNGRPLYWKLPWRAICHFQASVILLLQWSLLYL